MRVEVHFYNSMAKYAKGQTSGQMIVGDDATLGNLLHVLAISRGEIFILFDNGRGLLAGPRGHVEFGARLGEGDRLAFLGPIPFGRAYGTPVV